MTPSRSQIEQAAYERWERRGRQHGHDTEDWTAAERDLAFSLTYAVAARHRLSGPTVVLPADPAQRCRFCEQPIRGAATRLVPVVPEAFGRTALVTPCICGDCEGLFHESHEPAFERLLASLRALRAEIDLLGGRAWPSRGKPAPAFEVGALKAFTRVAMLLLPERDLNEYADALEWLTNPDDDQDAALLAPAHLYAYFPHVPLSCPALSLLRKADPESPQPQWLVLLADNDLVIQAPVPFGSRDDDRDGDLAPMPRLSLPSGHGPDFRDSLFLSLPLATRRAGAAGLS